MAKRFNMNLVKPSLKTYEGEGCQYQEYSKELNAMAPCGKACHKTFNVCPEHYDLLISVGINPKEKKKKRGE